MQTETSLSIATDSVVMVDFEMLAGMEDNAKCWGLFQIASALQFLHRDCQLLHGNPVLGYAIFTDRSGEWKLGGFELVCSLKDYYEYQVCFSRLLHLLTAFICRMEGMCFP